MKKLALVTVALMLFVAPAMAVQVWSGSHIYFYDDYEGVSSGSAPNNGAYPGDWQALSTSYAFVTNQAAAPPYYPGPYDGNNYLQQVAGLGYGTPPLVGTLDQTATGTIKVETMYWQHDGGGETYSSMYWGVGNSQTSSNLWLMTAWNQGPTIPPLLAWVDGTLTTCAVGLDEWNKMLLEYNPVTGAVSLTVTNPTYGTTNWSGTKAAIGAVDQVMLSRLDKGQYTYFDNAGAMLPEPTSMLVLALGAGLALLRRSR